MVRKVHGYDYGLWVRSASGDPPICPRDPSWSNRIGCCTNGSSTPLSVTNAYTFSFSRHIGHFSIIYGILFWRQTRRFEHLGSGRIIPRSGGVRGSFRFHHQLSYRGNTHILDDGVRLVREIRRCFPGERLASRLRTYLGKDFALHWRLVPIFGPSNISFLIVHILTDSRASSSSLSRTWFVVSSADWSFVRHFPISYPMYQAILH
jgi:hypothetical protein